METVQCSGRIGHTLLPALLNGREKVGGILMECREQFWWQYLPEWNWCVSRLQCVGRDWEAVRAASQKLSEKGSLVHST